MTRTAHPRGAAAKTEAAIKREARADVAVTKDKARRLPILDEIKATQRRARWSFTDEQLADIAAVFDAEAAGTIVCGCTKLARILKQRYDLPWAAASIRDRLLELRSTRS